LRQSAVRVDCRFFRLVGKFYIHQISHIAQFDVVFESLPEEMEFDDQIYLMEMYFSLSKNFTVNR